MAVVAGAELDAALVGQYLNTLVDDLIATGCPPTGVEAFLRNRQQILASLHRLIQSTPHPSPNEMRKLALRFALDPREPIEEPLNLFMYHRVRAGGQITQYPPGLGVLPCRFRVVKDPRTIKLLNLVYANPPDTGKLMVLIESVLGKRPQASDALSGETFARFTFEICPQPNKTWPIVRLWIEDDEVPLKKWEGIHLLLDLLCRKPQTSGTSKEIGESLEIGHIGQVTAAIKRALRGPPLAGGPPFDKGGWLETRPLRWATGHNPVPR
jgi:hypothetical protein